MHGRSSLLFILSLVLVIFVIACAHTPRMSKDRETEYIRMLREEFFKSHPEGEFNENIKRGEVLAGMGFLEVLASWGLPTSRSQSKDKSTEYWTYFGYDDASKDWSRYTFVFEQSRLLEWEMTRHVPGNRRTESIEPRHVSRFPLDVKQAPDRLTSKR